MRKAMREAEAVHAAELVLGLVRSARGPMPKHPIGIVLGTGWGDVLAIEDPIEIPFNEIPGLERVGALEGHARRLVVGSIGERHVLALRGRIHLNEDPSDPELPKMVRLQTELLFALGARTLIVTSAVGALRGKAQVGDVVLVDGFVTLFAPPMPLWAGEFVSPEDTLDAELRMIAREQCGALTTQCGGHAMVRGPFFEGRRYDKAAIAATGASVVGMSMLPEACVAALYGAKVLGLGFVTNDDVAEHSHEDNLASAKASAAHLGAFLKQIIAHIQ